MTGEFNAEVFGLHGIYAIQHVFWGCHPYRHEARVALRVLCDSTPV